MTGDSRYAEAWHDGYMVRARATLPADARTVADDIDHIVAVTPFVGEMAAVMHRAAAILRGEP